MSKTRLPEGWRLAKLGALCSIELGSTPARKSKSLWDEKRETGNVWLSIADMPNSLNAVASDSKEYVSDAAAKSMKVVPAGTLLVSFKLTLGRLCYAGRDLFTNEAIAALLNLDERAVTKEFLYWYLTFFDWQEAAAGDEKVKGKTLNKAKLKELEVWLPPLEEQKQIVAVLDHAFAALDRARALAEANLTDAEVLFQQTVDTLLADRPDWPKRSLKELGKIQTGGTPKSSDKGHYGQYIPFIKPGDFARDGSLNYNNDGLSEKGALSARRVRAGSALMVCIGATIGKAGYCTQDVTTNQQINSLTPNASADGRFIYYNFIKSGFQSEVIAKSGQATLPIINKSKWSELMIGVPSDLSVQVGIADKLHAMRLLVDQALAGYRQKLNDLAELRQVLLQQAFAGELT